MAINWLRGRNAVEQIVIYNAVGQLLSGFLHPYVRASLNLSNSAHPSEPISPEEAARLVIRHILTMDEGIEEAKQSGVTPGDFRKLVDGRGNPIGAAELADALRRGIIPEESADPSVPSFRGGIREGDIKDKWADVIKKLAVRIPSPADILEAFLEGQIERPEAERLYALVGGDAEYFELLYNTRGQAPTPTQAAEMANKGVIPWEGHGPGVVSFEQAFLEGPWRNKWLTPFREASKYRPPPRTVTAMVREGSLTDAEALKLWKDFGLTDELAQAYLKSAKNTKTEKERDLTLSITKELYREQVITKEQANVLLLDLGYDESESAYILQTVELERVWQNINRAINTVHSRYIGHKIDRADASAALDRIQVPFGQRDRLLSIWDEERAASVRLLTPAEIRQAWGRELFTPRQVYDRLRALGYEDDDTRTLMELWSGEKPAV